MRSTVSTILELGGIALVAVGAWTITPTVGFIASGLAAVLSGYLLEPR